MSRNGQNRDGSRKGSEQKEIQKQASPPRISSTLREPSPLQQKETQKQASPPESKDISSRDSTELSPLERLYHLTENIKPLQTFWLLVIAGTVPNVLTNVITHSLVIDESTSQLLSFLFILVCILLLFVFLTLMIIKFLFFLKKRVKINNRQRKWYTYASWSTAIIIFCASLFTNVIVITRPFWCPQILCTSSTRYPGNYDNNLEVYPGVVHSPYFAIPGDPESYSQNEPPEQTSALRLDRRGSYSIGVKVHSLRQDINSILIEKVDVVIDDILPSPKPLNVWSHNTGIDYYHNLYLAVFNEQVKGSDIPTINPYQPYPPYPRVQLSPGETDDITVQVNSRVIADFRFRIQITYRISDNAKLYTLWVPGSFEIVFSDASNWHEYQIQNGHFVVSP